jgi:phosphatidate cytidylyltransferase
LEEPPGQVSPTGQLAAAAASEQPAHPAALEQLERVAEAVSQHIDEVNRKAGRDLPAAVLVGLGLIAVIGATLLWWKDGFALLIMAGLCVGVWELNQAFRSRDTSVALPPLLAGGAVLILGVFEAARGLLPWSPAEVALSAVALTAVACLIWRLPGGVEGYVRDTTASLFIIVYPMLLGSTIVLMLADDRGAARIVLFVLSVVAVDTGGWVAGVLFGRHPMAPKISPKKSWEGLAGSFALAAVVGSGFGRLLFGFDWWQGFAVGAVLCVVGVLGDLVESAVKRDFGLKDLGRILPGHGGVMDRIDSYIVAAPVAWLTLAFLAPHV